MRTRPDVQQETLSRRLALVRAETAAEGTPEKSAWWTAHTAAVAWPGVEAAEGASPAVPESPVVALVPEPGRHAARRSLTMRPRLPEALQGHARLGPSQLTVIALVLAAALALTCWWLARGRATDLSPVSAPTAAASPLVPLAATGGGATATAVVAPSATSAAAMVTVDVEGKVRRPGIVILPTGSRVTDALKAAGGVPRRGTLRGLNLAAVLADGQQIVVGAPVAASSLGSGVPLPGATGDGGLVNLNTATAEELDTLPGVGPVTAQAILEWREQNGGFTSVQELLEVDGIGPATLEKLTPHVTV